VSDHLTHKLAVLRESVLQGKLPRNLHWTDALELIGHLGQVQSQGGDEFAFVVGAQREVFKRPHSPEVGVDDVSRLRRFLKRVAAESPPAAVARSWRMVVVIDHHAAHIYSELGSNPQDEVKIKPYDPHHFHHHLVHRKESHYQGDRVPEDTSFYEEVARSLVPASEIALVGHATGKSSALDVLVEHLKSHHSEVSRRVVANETVDLSALTPPEVEAIARRLMKQPNPARRSEHSGAR
jgi:hypothetical protein